MKDKKADSKTELSHSEWDHGLIYSAQWILASDYRLVGLHACRDGNALYQIGASRPCGLIHRWNWVQTLKWADGKQHILILSADKFGSGHGWLKFEKAPKSGSLWVADQFKQIKLRLNGNINWPIKPQSNILWYGIAVWVPPFPATLDPDPLDLNNSGFQTFLKRQKDKSKTE